MRATSQQRKKAGFTIIEMTAALAMTLTIAAILLGLIQQQLSFSQALRTFGFLRDEAPQINTLMTSLINQADNYRIFANLDSAKNFSNAVRTGGKSLRLRFRKPDGATAHGIIAFEEVNGKKQLNYYFKSENAIGWPSTPRWTVSSKPSNVTFDNSFGILEITMTGPNGDEITYTGNPE